jgi:predicted nucleotidyltransferase
MNIIFEGITGSRAYNLHTEDSDEDRKGIFVAADEELLGLKWGPGKETHNSFKPDIEYHEIGKYFRLAMKANPTLLELLYIENLKPSDASDFLVTNRHHFLSWKYIRDAYGGYAVQQACKLSDETMYKSLQKRYRKHARHCFRLLWLGRELLETGTLTVRLSDSKRKHLFSIGEMEPERLKREFDKEKKRMDECSTNLPETVDVDRLDKVLLECRKLTKESAYQNWLASL